MTSSNLVEQNKQIALKWFEAFNTKALEDLLLLYHSDAKHYSPKLKIRQPDTLGWVAGKPALRAWWADAFERLPSLRYDLKNLIVNDHQVFMEYVRRVEGEEDLIVGEVLEISNGLIVASRVYHG